jgi:tetratricopeptide (TPR) repeat protein
LTKEQELKIRLAMPGQYVTVFLTAEGVLMKGKGKPQVTAAELALPPKVRDEFTKGKNELKKKKYPAAIHHLEAVTRAQPQFALGFEVLGVAYCRSGDSAQAEAAFHTALDLDSKRAECYIQLGLLSYERQRYEDSQRYLETGLRMEPESWFGHYQLGLTYFALENYKESEMELRKAQDLDPSFSEVHVRLAPRVRQVVNDMRAAGVQPPS